MGLSFIFYLHINVFRPRIESILFLFLFNGLPWLVQKFWDAEIIFRRKMSWNENWHEKQRISYVNAFPLHTQCCRCTINILVFVRFTWQNFWNWVKSFCWALAEQRHGDNFQIDAMRCDTIFFNEVLSNFFLSYSVWVWCSLLMFDVTQFPYFVSFPFAIQFSFNREIWQKWQFSSWKIMPFAI